MADNTITIAPFSGPTTAPRPGRCEACGGEVVAVCHACRTLVCAAHRRVKWLEWPRFESYCAGCGT